MGESSVGACIPEVTTMNKTMNKTSGCDFWGKKEAHRILCLELDYDAERSEPPPCAVPIFGADPASSPCRLQLALKMEYMKLY